MDTGYTRLLHTLLTQPDRKNRGVRASRTATALDCLDIFLGRSVRKGQARPGQAFRIHHAHEAETIEAKSVCLSVCMGGRGFSTFSAEEPFSFAACVRTGDLGARGPSIFSCSIFV